MDRLLLAVHTELLALLQNLHRDENWYRVFYGSRFTLERCIEKLGDELFQRGLATADLGTKRALPYWAKRRIEAMRPLGLEEMLREDNQALLEISKAIRRALQRRAREVIGGYSDGHIVVIKFAKRWTQADIDFWNPGNFTDVKKALVETFKRLDPHQLYNFERGFQINIQLLKDEPARVFSSPAPNNKRPFEPGFQTAYAPSSPKLPSELMAPAGAPKPSADQAPGDPPKASTG
jgi:hypothetical protein